jgi:hypothetical protein
VTDADLWTAEQIRLAAVLADPGDDLPRLKFADHLDETAGTVECSRCKDRGAVGWDYVNGVGQPPKVYPCPECTAPGYEPKSDGRRERAEFIRVQVEVARTENYPGERFCGKANGLLRVGVADCEECRPCSLRRRERELFSQVCDVFPRVNSSQVRLDSQQSGGWPVEMIVRRGFVESVTCDWTMWAGGACGRCEGAGRDAVWEDRCGHCDGTGRTPGLASRLLWRAEVKCPRCKGDKGRLVTRPNKQVVHEFDACGSCGVTGRVRNPDPPPPTAQPVTEVVLTDRPRVSAGREFCTLGLDVSARGLPATAPFSRLRVPGAAPTDGNLLELLAAEYPGVTFRLPAA